MTRTTRAVAIIVPVLVLARTTAAAEGENPNKALYLKYCGACHGPGGKGDGIAGTFMRPKPADLTQIAKQNGGQFPARKTMEIIDGRTTVRAHGDPDMPVWGEIFQDQASWDVRRRTDVQEKIRSITDHLATIQEK
jgi:mono/diheme cytochrome c family protein